MTKRLITGTADERGRRIFVQPADGWMKLVSNGRIRLDKIEPKFVSRAVLLPAGYHPNVSIPGASLNFVWIMAAHREVVDRKWGVVQVDPRYG